MRILLIYPGHSHSTIDIAIGYERAFRELGHVVEAFDYHHHIAFYTTAISYWNEQFNNGTGRIGWNFH